MVGISMPISVQLPGFRILQNDYENRNKVTATITVTFSGNK